MSKEKIRDLLGQLRLELKSTDVDPATLSLLQELDTSLSGGADQPAAHPTLVDRVRALDVRFAARHERAETLLRQVVDLLGKIGV